MSNAEQSTFSMQKGDRAASLSSASPPTSERQRVRRACDACRKKKIKCNGLEPCERCKAYKSRCEYSGPDQNVQSNESSGFRSLQRRVATMGTQFETRLTTIEELMRTLSDQINESRTTRNQETNNPAQSVNTTVEGAPSPPKNPPFGITELTPPVDSNIDTVPKQQCQTSSGSTQLGQDTAKITPPGRDQTDVENGQDDAASEETTDIPRFYADEYGELINDDDGMRYVGLGSTAFVLDGCDGLRRHISDELRRKGYDSENNFSPDSTSTMNRVGFLGSLSGQEWELPPWELVDALSKTYMESVYPIFPIITGGELWAIYTNLLVSNVIDTGPAAVLMAGLAAAAPLLPDELHLFDEQHYSKERMAPYFFNLSLHISNSQQDGSKYRKGRSEDEIIACGLLGVYLAEMGSQAEAWVMIGRAIRLGQDAGLHRSPERLRLPLAQQQNRRLVWWCLYILERQLSFALGRPLTIRDKDCDVEPLDEGAGYGHSIEVLGVQTLVQLLGILGTIHETIYSVKNARKWRDAANAGLLRSRVGSLYTALQKWANEQVPDTIRRATNGKALVQSQVSLLTYYLAIIELYRPFMAHPHRQSLLERSEAQSRCAKAAVDCIQGSQRFLEVVPTGHYHVLHGQSLLICATALMQISRHSDESSFFPKAVQSTELALQGLRRLEGTWHGAFKSQRILEEYLQITVLAHEGFYKKNACNFHFRDSKAAHISGKPDSLKRRVDKSPALAGRAYSSYHRAKSRKIDATRIFPGIRDFDGGQMGFQGAELPEKDDELSLHSDQTEYSNFSVPELLFEECCREVEDGVPLDFGFANLFDMSSADSNIGDSVGLGLDVWG